jgi:hypothetical protein
LFAFTDATSNAGPAALAPPGAPVAEDCAWIRGIVTIPAARLTSRLVHTAVTKADIFMGNVSF